MLLHYKLWMPEPANGCIVSCGWKSDNISLFYYTGPMSMKKAARSRLLFVLCGAR